MGKADDATQATSNSDEVTMATATTPFRRRSGYEQAWVEQESCRQQRSSSQVPPHLEGEDAIVAGAGSVMRGSFVRPQPPQGMVNPRRNANENNFDITCVALDEEQPPLREICEGHTFSAMGEKTDPIFEVAELQNSSAKESRSFPNEEEDTKSRISLSSQAQRQHRYRVLLVGSIVLALLGVCLPVVFVVWGRMSSQDNIDSNSKNDIKLNNNIANSSIAPTMIAPASTTNDSTPGDTIIPNGSEYAPIEPDAQNPSVGKNETALEEVYAFVVDSRNETTLESAVTVPPPPVHLDMTCSFQNLVTTTGYASCQRACAPAGCCWQENSTSCREEQSECIDYTQHCAHLNIKGKQAQVDAACSNFEKDSATCLDVCAVATCCFASASIHSACEAIVACDDYEACRILHK